MAHDKRAEQRHQRRRWGSGLAALCVLLLLGAACASDPVSTALKGLPDGGAEDVFITPEALEARIDAGAPVVILDARGYWDFRAGHIPGAQRAAWDDFTTGGLRSGKLAERSEIAATLAALGVSYDVPVVLVGDWHLSWGEEGRLHWMLEYLGHKEARVLYGGVPLWRQRGLPMEEGGAGEPTARAFDPQPESARRADVSAVLTSISSKRGTIIDVRSDEEWGGETPFWSSRGGRIPSATHLWWRQVFDQGGDLLPVETLRAMLVDRGVDLEKEILLYCVAGVRSGFMYTILRWVGASKVRNYDGSWWEWSSREDVPVQTGAP